MRHFTLTMLALLFSVVASFAITPISPSSGGLCVGGYLYLTDSLAPGGTWSCSPTSVATISGSSVGSLYGVSAGVVNVTYTTSAGSAYGTYTVSPVPAPIGGGPTSFCVGATATFTNATPGGIWSTSSYTGYASIDAATGVATGVTPGMFYVRYTVAGCATSSMDTVLGASPGFIGGPSTVCVGSSISLTDSIGSGSTWSSSNIAVATVSGTGVVTGVAVGTATISLAYASVCGTLYSTHVVTVTTGSVGPISGPGAITVGGTGSYVASPSGGTWSATPSSVATIDASGVLTGVSAGPVVITYSAVSCGTPMSATTTVSVNPFDGISGNVNFSTPYYGMVKVWLIHYDPTAMTLNALDSVTTYLSGGSSAYYEFAGLPTDSFRVKAAVPDSFTSTTSYIPTYHLSHYYWHDADVINHTAGTSDIHQDINMLYGSSASGPGFISGSVLTGANRGTSLGTPVVGLHMVCMTSTGTVTQMAYTDASGNYTFSSLPYGSYTVFPDSLNYFTTPLTGITLSASTPGFSTAGFQQHNLLKTITPGTLGINTPVSVASVTTFPNPTSGKLNIVWNQKAEERASITISDITGREVFATTIAMTEGTGATSINLSSLISGLYVINVKSTSLNYTSKLEIQK